MTISSPPLVGFNSDSSSTEAQAQQSARVSCPQCGEQKIARSRPRSSDRLTQLFLPKRPYRCLRCYHRFWQKEAFTDNTRRVRTWIWISALILGFILWQFIMPSERAVTATSLGTSEPKSFASHSVEVRNLIQESGFQPPRSADLELTELADAGVSRAEIRDKLKAAHVLAVAPVEPNTKAESALLDLSTPTALPLSANQNAAAQAKNSNRVPDSSSEEQQILNMLEQWRLAWEQGNSDRYLEFYGLDFTPSRGVSRDRWQRLRRDRVTPDKQIRLSMSDVRVQLDLPSNKARVRFQQEYRSATYQDVSVKELQLNRIANQWYIATEVQL